MKKTAICAAVCLLLCLMPCRAAAESETVKLPVVMYHHISTRPEQYNDYVLSLDEFCADMDYLRDNGWHSVSVRELIAWSRGELELPEKPFMITFDDGFESTLAYAEPVLREHGFTGVLAVIGSVCSRFSELDEHYPEWSNMSWEDASAMSRRGVIEVQCHTWDMHALSPRRGCSQMRGESDGDYVRALSADLERFLAEAQAHGVDIVPSIAYPYGAFSSKTRETVESLGFLAAFTCDEKVAELERTPQSLFRIARFNRPHGVSSENFFKKWEEAVDTG